MIKNIDFAPQVTKKGGLFKSTEVEKFQEIVNQMNDWIAAEKPEIINIETVLLPNIHDSDEEGSEDTMLGTGRESSSHWYQFIRVWYKE
ncbi:MAG: hypothetical protein AAGA66_02775 [Bacteroidota bacterium]